MSAVWYTGRANSRTISVAEWASVGVTVAQPTVWDKSNGYSLPQSGFSPTQLTILGNNENFQINAADGPRTGAVPESVPRTQALAKLSDLDDLQTAINPTYARTSDAILTAPRPRPPVNTKLITSFQAGHGFTNFNSTASAVTDDTSDFMLGTQSLKVTTKTDNTAGSVQGAIPAIDTTGKSLRLAVKVSDLANLTELMLYVATDSTMANYYQWTVLTTDLAAQGGFGQSYMKPSEWVWITLGFQDPGIVGAPTRSALAFARLRTRSANGTSITVNYGGLALTDESTAFPNGVVSFCYDDSYASQYTEARKALDKYGWTGTLYTICDLVGSSASYLSVAQLKLMQRAGWEIAAHAYTMADHQTGFHNMTSAQLHDDFRNMRRWLNDNGLDAGDHLAYPQGGYNATVLDVARRYFASARTVNRRTLETLRPSSALRLRSFSVDSNDLTATVQQKIDAAKANKSWLILTYHDLNPSPSNTNQVTPANHQTIVDYCNTVGIAVRPVGDVLRTGA